MIFKLFIFLFSFSNAYAGDFYIGKCEVFSDKKPGSKTISSLAEKYKAEKVRVCQFKNDTAYYVYSGPFITSEGMCYIENFDVGLIKNGKPEALDPERPADSRYRLFSNSRDGKCQKDYHEYAGADGVSYQNQKIIFNFIDFHRGNLKPFSILEKKKNFVLDLADFDVFNKLFLADKLFLTDVSIGEVRRDFWLRFVSYDQSGAMQVFWLEVRVKYGGEVVAQRFSRLVK